MRILKRATGFCSAFFAVIFLLIGFSTHIASAADENQIITQGEALYSEHCARCHGANGEGKPEEYDEPLYGDRSIKSLAGLIERTMPEDEPERIVGEDALRVATFAYHKFYSAQAREALLPAPRIELARLTVSQYRNALADLIGAFPEALSGEPSADKSPDRRNGQPGFDAEYFQSKGMSKADELKIERHDPFVDFDFGTGSPAEDISADQFAAIWQGALFAQNSGYYEFRVTTPNGARLYLNAENTGQRRKMRDDSSVAGQEAVIDGWVSSGKMREHTARLFLLGGRRYPIRLEFFKYKEETASIRFEWKPPHAPWQLVDDRYVSSQPTPRVYVASTPFPPDDRSAGYERGSSVSPGWHEAITQGALAAANEIIDRLPSLAKVREDDKDRATKLQSFLTHFAELAFRRPLTEAETTLLKSQLFADAETPDTAVRRAVLFVLTSPHFLYTTPGTPDSSPNSHTIAARLALTLWDSIPDLALRQAAAKKELSTRNQIQRQIQRMLKDDRTRSKVHDFFAHWLEAEDRDLSKDQKLYPDFDEHTMDDLRYSLNLFIDEVVWSEESDYRDLLLSEHLLLNDRLAKLYAPDGQADENSPDGRAFRPVSLSGQRSGILTHPFVLSAFAYHNTTSPIHRGVFLTRNIMGRGLKPPPEAVAFKNDEFPDDLSMREKITRLTSDAACMTCHSVINPLGFALENFDAVGRWRDQDNQVPVDSSSEYITIEGESRQFQSARDLARYAVTSPTAHTAFITDLFRYLVKQTPEAYGRESLDSLRAHFQEKSFSIQQLIAEIALVSSVHDANIGDN